MTRASLKRSILEDRQYRIAAVPEMVKRVTRGNKKLKLQKKIAASFSQQRRAAPTHTSRQRTCCLVGKSFKTLAAWRRKRHSGRFGLLWSWLRLDCIPVAGPCKEGTASHDVRDRC